MKDFFVNDDEIKPLREKKKQKNKRKAARNCVICILRVTQEYSLWSFMTETSEKLRSTIITLQ